MAPVSKRVRKEPDRFVVFKEGDKHPPMSVRSSKTKKRKDQRLKNKRFKESKKLKTDHETPSPAPGKEGKHKEEPKKVSKKKKNSK